MKRILISTISILLASVSFCVASGDLLVSGEIKVGNSASLCNSGNEGRIRYNAVDKVMELCNGTDWLLFSAVARYVPPIYYTKLLLHLDSGSDFYDYSSVRHPTTNNGVTINSLEGKFDQSGYFNGGSYLSFADSEDWNFGSSDFTVEFWVKRSSVTTGAEQRITGQTNGATANHSFNISINGTTNILTANYGIGDTLYSVGNQPVNDTNWHHIAATRASGVFYLFIDGILAGSNNSTLVAVNNSTTELSIGRQGSSASLYFQGYIDEFRIAKGIAQWTTNFTPPGSPYDGRE
jgi:hypothetical protein